MKFGVTICATNKYAYALTVQARRLQSACDHIERGTIIIVGDGCAKVKEAITLYKELMPNWSIEEIVLDIKDDNPNYKPPAQFIISKMRTAAFTRARTLKLDQCLSLDSDVLPYPGSVQAMQQSLDLFDGFYSIATCPYPSQGGGGYLGGRGTVYKSICPNVYEDERQLPESVAKEIADIQEKLQKAGRPRNEQEFKLMESLHRRLGEVYKAIEQFPPKGDVFTLNANGGWKKRGWMEYAYPGIGIGGIVPTDWCGFGCTLLNKKALALAHFDGYHLVGTEDLYIVWHRWYQAGLKINVITHCPADHVIRNPGKPGYFIVQQGCHETEGEQAGHLRIKTLPFYSFDNDEVYDPENDGRFVNPPPEQQQEQLLLNFNPPPPAPPEQPKYEIT